MSDLILGAAILYQTDFLTIARAFGVSELLEVSVSPSDLSSFVVISFNQMMRASVCRLHHLQPCFILGVRAIV